MDSSLKLSLKITIGCFVSIILIFLGIRSLNLKGWFPTSPIPSPVNNSQVFGDSMCPTYCNGQFVQYTNRSPQADDVIIFDNLRDERSAPVIKRLIKIDGDNWWIEGDNVNSNDSRDYGWLTPQDRIFIGVVVGY